MKLILTEKQILTTIRLSGVQKAILAKIIAAPTPELAYEQISDGRNFVATRDILKKLGLIDFDEGTASVTEEGKRVMRDENLIDPSGQLTSEGQQYVEPTKPSEIDNPISGQADADASTNPDENQFGSENEFDTAPEDELDLSTDDMGGQPNDNEDPFADENAPTRKKSFESLLSQVNKNRTQLSESTQPITFTLRETLQMETGKDLSDNLLDKIQQFVIEYDSSWMPSHVQKAVLSNPHDWVIDQLDQIVSVINASSRK